MASDARRNFQSHATPVSTPTLQIDDAMLSLNDALDDLGKLRIRTDACKVDLNLSTEEAKVCVEAFIGLLDDMVVPDIFTTSVDIELLRVLPDIINSPYINIEPGMYVMYYNALYYGLNQIRGPGDAQAQGMYLKILEAVPAWLESPVVTEMDGHTAALTAWTATSNHDYQLSWKFHCKSCHYVKTRKLDQIDLIPARTFEEEDQKEGARYLYWHVLSTDTLFRLFYGKPTVVSMPLDTYLNTFAHAHLNCSSRFRYLSPHLSYEATLMTDAGPMGSPQSSTTARSPNSQLAPNCFTRYAVFRFSRGIVYRLTPHPSHSICGLDQVHTIDSTNTQ
jgi:hypothetical protein